MVDLRCPTCISFAMFGEEKSTKTFLLGNLGPLTPSENMVSKDDTSAVVAMKILINPLGWKTRERGEEVGRERWGEGGRKGNLWANGTMYLMCHCLMGERDKVHVCWSYTNIVNLVYEPLTVNYVILVTTRTVFCLSVCLQDEVCLWRLSVCLWYMVCEWCGVFVGIGELWRHSARHTDVAMPSESTCCCRHVPHTQGSVHIVSVCVWCVSILHLCVLWVVCACV